MTWAENDWVDTQEHRQSMIATAVVISLFVAGGTLYAVGLFVAATGGDGLVAIAGGLLVLLATIYAAMALYPYRRIVGAPAPRTVFHISSAVWAVDDLVTLEVARCHKKQAITEKRWPRRARLVYFFRQRPTLGHARGQSFSGRRRTPRYLYELQLQRPIDALYGRGAVVATPADVSVIVVARQDLGSSWKDGATGRRPALSSRE